MKKALLSISVILVLMGCGGKSNNPAPAGTGTNTSAPAPVAASLTSPAQNAVCTTGTVLSPTTSSITFTWAASANTDSYELDLKNLLTGATTSQSTSQTQLAITLSRNTPYSWYIVSQSAKTTATAQSDVWKFYNAGLGIVTYAPFPAAITAPTFGQSVTAMTGTVNLTWTGSSVNPNTIASYDVYFGTTASLAKLASAITNSFLNNVTVVSGATYYWKVITTDVNGNTSDSGLYQFTVN